MKLFRSSVVVLLATIGLLVQSASPAAAANIGGGNAAVRIRTSSGLAYPGFGPPQTGTFTIYQTIACEAQIAGKTIGITAACTINATGTFNPNPSTTNGAFCGRSTGIVTGTITAPGFPTIGFTGDFSTAASAVIIIGTASSGTQAGPFTFQGDATPDPTTTTSCRTANQQEFIAVGIFDAIMT